MWGVVFSRKAFYGMVRISDLFILPVDYILFFPPRAKSSIFLLKCGYGSRSGPKRKLRVE
jgi:hypothetical protein